jgi:hypothetical protein
MEDEPAEANAVSDGTEVRRRLGTHKGVLSSL